MDQYEFSRRLRALAGATEREYPVSEIDAMGILGRLGFARLVRRFQATMLAAGAGTLAVISMKAFPVSAPLLVAALALAHAYACIAVVRIFPYWTPPTALCEGLLALSRFEFNDWCHFDANMRNPLTTVNNTLLSDLCNQLSRDQRRQKIEIPNRCR
ncbi:hypothetical protein [Pseudomonas sp. MWU12-2323]|uniref:hypothetical protein n=1 Tax=Pseudomonas sp. MWU12-2323 TaxID=2651296 RepID=UPI00128B72FE|nr:hypothetical protein [Pseudomonas sp. MWU12-2323]MPQ71477.1 hypothetical protein [Pseudomonas sp. MWU12-2323]